MTRVAQSAKRQAGSGKREAAGALIWLALAMAALGQAPTVNNNGGASNVTTAAAVINGSVVSTGAANPTILLFWGVTDGTTNKASWATTNNLGARGTGLFSTNFSGLTPNTRYYYRAYATNSAGDGWAPQTTNFLTLAGAPTSTPPPATLSVTVDTDIDLVGLFTNLFWRNSTLLQQAIDALQTNVPWGQLTGAVTNQADLWAYLGSQINTNAGDARYLNASGNDTNLSFMTWGGFFIAGNSNNAWATSGGVLGGTQNIIEAGALWPVIAGGRSNYVSADGNSAFLGGGDANRITKESSAQVGGLGNSVGGAYSFGGGGAYNKIYPTREYMVLAGGLSNEVYGTYSVGVGGFRNRSTAEWSTVVGGTYQDAYGLGSFIGGGSGHRAGLYSTVPGGTEAWATGSYSFAAGRRAKAGLAGTFVWADSEDADFAATNANETAIRAAGGFRVKGAGAFSGELGASTVRTDRLRGSLPTSPTVEVSRIAFAATPNSAFYVDANTNPVALQGAAGTFFKFNGASLPPTAEVPPTLATNASFSNLTDVVLSGAALNDLWIWDGTNRLRRITPAQLVALVAVNAATLDGLDSLDFLQDNEVPRASGGQLGVTNNPTLDLDTFLFDAVNNKWRFGQPTVTATNSDTLDLLDSEQFLRSDADDYTTGRLAVSNDVVVRSNMAAGAFTRGAVTLTNLVPRISLTNVAGWLVINNELWQQVDTNDAVGAGGPGAVTNLNDLADVDSVAAPTAGHVLKWNGSTWTNAADETSAGFGGASNVWNGVAVWVTVSTQVLDSSFRVLQFETALGNTNYWDGAPQGQHRFRPTNGVWRLTFSALDANDSAGWGNARQAALYMNGGLYTNMGGTAGGYLYKDYDATKEIEDGGASKLIYQTDGTSTYQIAWRGSATGVDPDARQATLEYIGAFP